MLLSNEERFETFVELSLDIGEMDLSQFRIKAKDELVPDICIYAESPPILNEEVDDDLLRVSQIPDLAIATKSLPILWLSYHRFHWWLFTIHIQPLSGLVRTNRFTGFYSVVSRQKIPQPR